MRGFISVVLGLAPFLALQAQPALPVSPPQRWSISSDCNQRIGEDFHPMTRTERAALYVNSLFSVRTFVFTGIRAGINQGLDSPEEWPNSWRGYGYRAASAYGQSAISTSVESGIALAMDEDNRYFASGEHGVWPRLKYAIASTFLARRSNGTRRISVSALAGPAAGAGISRLWQPDSTNSAGDAAESFGVTIGANAAFNVAREFLPRSWRKLLP